MKLKEIDFDLLSNKELVEICLKYKLLEKIIPQEDKWLNSQHKEISLSRELEKIGWTIECEEWEETLVLEIDESLENRWLGEGCLYRNFLEQEFTLDFVYELRHLIKINRGRNLPQKLLHRRLVGKKR